MKRIQKRGDSRRMKRFAMKHMARDVFLLYRLFEEPACSAEISIGDGRVYSLSVTKISEGGRGRTIRYIHDIARTRTEADHIFSVLSRACVPPETAEEITGDLIGFYEIG